MKYCLAGVKKPEPPSHSMTPSLQTIYHHDNKLSRFDRRESEEEEKKKSDHAISLKRFLKNAKLPSHFWDNQSRGGKKLWNKSTCNSVINHCLRRLKLIHDSNDPKSQSPA